LLAAKLMRVRPSAREIASHSSGSKVEVGPGPPFCRGRLDSLNHIQATGYGATVRALAPLGRDEECSTDHLFGHARLIHGGIGGGSGRKPASRRNPRQCRSSTDNDTGDVVRRVRLLMRAPSLQVGSDVCDNMCEGLHMATNLSIDPDLLDRALEVSGERTKKAAVTKALQEFIARRQQKRLLELIGKLEWDAAFDYKAERSRR
jgi:Arc/MetJ family transcription regulator